MAGPAIVQSNQPPPATMKVTIANAASLTPAIDLLNMRLRRIAMPAAWTAANLTFQVSFDGVTYSNLFSASAELALTGAAAGIEILVNKDDFASIRFLKIRSGTSGTPVAQGGSRDLQLVLMP